MKTRTNLESHESRTPEGQQIVREIRNDIMELKVSAAPPDLTRDFEAKIESQKNSMSSKGSTIKAGLLGRIEPQFDSICLC